MTALVAGLALLAGCSAEAEPDVPELEVAVEPADAERESGSGGSEDIAPDDTVSDDAGTEARGVDPYERPDEISEDVWGIITHDPGWEPSKWDFDDFPLPTCSEIEQRVGEPLGDLTLANEVVTPPERELDPFSLTCTWFTDVHDRMAQGEVGALWEMSEGGALLISVNVPPSPLTKEDVQEVGFYVEDERAEDLGGYVFAPPALDLGEKLNELGVTVSVDGVDVTVHAGNVLMTETGGQLDPFTNDWGIAAAVAVHELIWE